MENSSKALLIAAAVLIVILIVTISIKILTPAEGVVKDAEEIGETMSGASQGAVDKLQSSLGTSIGNKEKIQIGDKVAYDEGSKETTIDNQKFTTEDLDWRVLSIESNGRVNLISTRPTSSTLNLSGEEGYLNAETNLDKLCNDLYANGPGITARSLKVEDVLGRIEKNEVNIGYPYYENLYRYRYNSETEKIQYSKSKDNGVKWSEYKDTSYSSFKEPGKEEINSNNYENEDGTQIVIEQKYTYYVYTVKNKVTQTTSDGISMADLIEKGLNNSNNAATASYKKQWLSSRCVICYGGYADFGVRILNGQGTVSRQYLWISKGSSNTGEYAVRPVVSLPASVLSPKFNGVWQVNI